MKTRFVFREAFSGLTRNMTMTIAMIITTAISLALLATGFLVTSVTAKTKDIYLDRVEVMVQLDDNISANDKNCSSTECKEVQDKLKSDNGVESVTFRSREQSYEHFKELFQDSDPRLVADTSPDALPAALHVRLKDPLNTKPLDGVKDMPQVSEVVDQVDDLRGATNNLNAIRNATFVVAFVQAIAAVFLIVNMVQIAAYSRRQETTIMRMVGATRWFTQAPFVLEAVLASFVGSLVAIGGLILGKEFVLDKTLKSLYDSRLIARLTLADIGMVSPIIIIVGVVFAAITAQATLRWYVRD